jgi:ABC-2 type transport system ATP-binding protein
MEYAIETFSLTKVFSDWWGRDKVYAVNDLNLKIRSNEVFGLLGPNGSGKTTTLKMLLNLLHPTKGRAVVFGGDSSDTKINSRIGFLPEESYLYRYLNARETLDFYGRLFGLPRQVRKTRIEALLEMVGLTGVANRPVGMFSKGMARRIGLAQALINDPELLILDEPTTGLDPIGTRQIKDLVLKLARRGKTILLCSHLLADVEDVCDRIAILYGGKIQAEGKVKELLVQSGKRQIVTGGISDRALEQIRRIVQSEQTEFEVTSPMDKLESYFIRTVMAAQQNAQPTSGAVSTTRISGFLSEETTVESILDKLVSAPTDDEQLSAKPSQAARPQGSEESESRSKVDEGVLRELTGPAKSALSETVTSESTGDTKPVKTVRDEDEQARKHVLDELTRAGEADGTTENSDGDSDDA